MPKYNFMISRAVDLVARKLAGMDSDTVARLTQVLSEEAQMISEELQHSGQNVSSDILAARLEGVVARMKYEIRNQGPDPSPHEFPIFNVSHNPQAPYPNPINHLYDKRYKEAYATFIKQDQPASSTSQKSEPSTPTSPSATKPPPSQAAPQPPTNPKPSPQAVYPQGQYQQQSHRQAPQPPTNPKPSPQAVYPQGQYQQQSNRQAPQPIGAVPSFHQQPAAGWQYVNPYATMPRSHAAYYQQQAARMMQPIQEHSSANTNQPVRRSSTGEDFQSHHLSRSVSSNDVNYSANSGAEKIRVRVINDNSNPSSTPPQTSTYPNNRYNAQRSILKPSSNGGDNREVVPTRTIYAAPNTEIGTETMQDLFKVVNRQRSESSGSTTAPQTERVIIIDRRGGSTTDNNQDSGKERYRAFEIRSPAAAPTSSTPTPTPATTIATSSTPTASTSSATYAMPQVPYYAGQQAFYRQPKVYGSAPNILHSAASPYVLSGNNFYPYPFYHY